MNCELGRLVAACYNGLHPLLNKPLQKYLISTYGLNSATEIMVKASESLALHRRRHLLAFLEQQ